LDIRDLIVFHEALDGWLWRSVNEKDELRSTDVKAKCGVLIEL